jgi:hypothetical protein
MSALVGSYDFYYHKNTHINQSELKDQLNFHLNNGILFQVESMLSCFSTEHTMVYEHFKAIQALHYVVIHIPLNYKEFNKEADCFLHVDIKKYENLFSF